MLFGSSIVVLQGFVCYNIPKINITNSMNKSVLVRLVGVWDCR